MLAGQVTEQTVIHMPTLLRVWQEREQSQSQGWQVMVYVSLLIGPMDKIYLPVKELLDSLGARLVSQVTVEDPMMMWGQATLSVYGVELSVVAPEPTTRYREKARAA